MRSTMFINSSSLSFLVSIGFGLRKVCVETGSKLNRQIHLSSSQNETFLSGVVLKGKQIKVCQHYFEEPVLQPRSATNQRREADLTGLKGLYNFYCVVHFLGFYSTHISTINEFIFHYSKV